MRRGQADGDETALERSRAPFRSAASPGERYGTLSSRTRTHACRRRCTIRVTASIVVMKAIAQRTRDVADVEGILETCDHLDIDWIRVWLTEFDRALGRADLLAEFERTVARTRRQALFDGLAG